MLISLVNHSAKIVDAKLQATLRALNRQLDEDFAPHWGRGGRLRLEGRSAPKPVPERASDIRGEAVIYLCDLPEDSQDALGYHELNHRGIPYGFVFTELSRELEEPWSLTLSHEVLELVVDAEANLLVKGPHPEDPTREVFDWYEVCDAVQTQSYVIDGERVSNFVLPLYFTTHEEPGGRNDFLGATRRAEPKLASFGVADGGHLRYFDPEVGDDRFYEPTEKARKRTRSRAAPGSRAAGSAISATPLRWFTSTAWSARARRRRTSRASLSRCRAAAPRRERSASWPTACSGGAGASSRDRHAPGSSTSSPARSAWTPAARGSSSTRFAMRPAS